MVEEKKAKIIEFKPKDSSLEDILLKYRRQVEFMGVGTETLEEMDKEIEEIRKHQKFSFGKWKEDMSDIELLAFLDMTLTNLEKVKKELKERHLLDKNYI